MEREFIIAKNLLARDIYYTGWTKKSWGEYYVHFNIENVKYDYVMILKDVEILDWMRMKKKLNDMVLLNYAKKKAYEVYKDGIRIKPVPKEAKRKTAMIVGEFSQMCIEKKDENNWQGMIVLQHVTKGKQFKEVQKDGIKFSLKCNQFINSVKSMSSLGKIKIDDEGDFFVTPYYEEGFVMTEAFEIFFEGADVKGFEDKLVEIAKKYGNQFKQTCDTGF